jgi:hypothetical protein
VDDAEDIELFKRVWYANRDGRIDIGIDLRHFNKAGSPTFEARDNALPIVATACCTATAWMLGGWIWGLAIFGSGIIFSMTTLNIWLMQRLRKRTIDLALSSAAGWEEMWRYGGVSLRRAGQELETIGPAQDWRTFARTLPMASRYEE